MSADICVKCVSKDVCVCVKYVCRYLREVCPNVPRIVPDGGGGGGCKSKTNSKYRYTATDTRQRFTNQERLLFCFTHRTFTCPQHYTLYITTAVHSVHHHIITVYITTALQSVHYHSSTQCTPPQQYTLYITSLQCTSPQQYTLYITTSLQCTSPQQYTLYITTSLQCTSPQQYTVYITTSLECTPPQHYTVYITTACTYLCVCVCVRACVSACMHTDQCHVCINGLNSLSLLFGASYFLIALVGLCCICVQNIVFRLICIM